MQSIRPVILMIGLATLVAGCATTDERQDWRAHPTHFATDNHLSFSVTNAAAGAPRITPEMVQRAKTESWWGTVITVKPEQIFEPR